MHGAAHNVGAFGAQAAQQLHGVHGVQKLAVGRLEAVDIRQRARHDHRHGIGHIVGFQRVGDGRFHHQTGIVDLHRFAQLGAGSGAFGSFLFSHF